MAVPSSGQLRLRGDIALEIDGVATGLNISLRTLAASAGKASPDSMSEFYGYSSASAPSVSTNTLTGANETFMTLSGNVTSDGGAGITQRGFRFGTNGSSPTNNSAYSVGGGTGSYSLQRTGLNPNTTYYCWAYATNSVGTTYGPRRNAATLATFVPSFVYDQRAYIQNMNITYKTSGVYVRMEIDMRKGYVNPNTGSLVYLPEYSTHDVSNSTPHYSDNRYMNPRKLCINAENFMETTCLGIKPAHVVYPPNYNQEPRWFIQSYGSSNPITIHSIHLNTPYSGPTYQYNYPNYKIFDCDPIGYVSTNPQTARANYSVA